MPATKDRIAFGVRSGACPVVGSVSSGHRRSGWAWQAPILAPPTSAALCKAAPFCMLAGLQPIESFLDRLESACADGTLVRLLLSSPTAEDAKVQRLLARLVDLKDGPALSCTLREARRDTTENVPLAKARAYVAARLCAFRAGLLQTTTADWQLQASPDGPKLIRHKPSAKAAPSRAHDQDKPTFLGGDAAPWLQALGIIDAQGRTRPKLADKRAQIDRFCEVLFHLCRDCGFVAQEGAPLSVVDVGCGKGHLSFAAWHLAKTSLRREPEVLGVEARADLVDEANARAAAAGAQGLRFACGDIATAPLQGVDVLVALHACNTATDHAIRRGVESRARLIVVAPCCHQEVRPQLRADEPLAAALRHGLFAERMAEWATDALRALVLEWAGYTVKAIEFVGSEHTGKNLMLAAVRREASTDAAERARLRAQVDAFRAFFGIASTALDPLLATEPAG